MAEAANILIPEATAKVSMRIVPGADAEHELELLVAHLQVGRAVERRRSRSPRSRPAGRSPSTWTAPAVQAAEAGLTAGVRDRRWRRIGSGGSIPLINSLKNACPRADVILWGAEDTTLSRIHASNESVDPAEIERMVIAQVLTLRQLGSG